MRFILLGHILFVTSPAQAAFNCLPSRNQITAQRDVVRKKLKPKKIAQIDDADRKTADDFGAVHTMTGDAVEKRYAATGDLDCPALSGQAQVTVKNDTIVTAAHLFNKKMDCKNVTPFKSCKFITRLAGVDKTYRLKQIVGTGHKCPLPVGKKSNGPQDDWVVLKLEEATDPRITPYGIPIYGRNTLENGKKVVAVAKSNDWGAKPGTPLLERPRHYGDCEIKNSAVHGTRRVATNCDMSGGSSGGSMVTPGDAPVLLGIVRGEVDPSLVEGCDAAKYKSNTGEYHAECWWGGMVAVTGDFKDTIMKATGLTDDGREQGPTPNGTGFKLPGINLKGI